MDIDKNLELIINNDSWQDLIVRSRHVNVVDIYLNNDDKKYPNVFRHKFIIKLCDDITKTPHLMLLFPNHPDDRKRVMRTTDYKEYYKLSKEINTRLKESLNGETVKLAIVYKTRIYRVRDIYGTCYMLWSERINCETMNQKQNQIAEKVPVFFELNGEHTIRNVIPLLPDLVKNDAGRLRLYPIVTSSTSLIVPTDVVLFSCEVDARKDHQRTIETISGREADAISKDPAVRTLVRGLNGEDIPSELEDETVDSVVVGSSTQEEEEILIEIEPQTPRVVLPKNKDAEQEDEEVIIPV